MKNTPLDFNRLIQQAMSRRRFLNSAAAFGVSAFIIGCADESKSISKRPNLNSTQHDNVKSSLLGFDNIAANGDDTITLPHGYQWRVLASWGDPILKGGMAFDEKTRGTSSSQALAIGDNNDGMHLFTLSDTQGVFVVNNEYINLEIFSPEGVNSAEEAAKGRAAHGVSIFAIEKVAGQWRKVIDSPYNRRITADTPMQITGPARGSEFVKTIADPKGIESLGTWNNCGNGYTPWGTYLTCEENFDDYFGSSDKHYKLTDMHKRYGIKHNDRGYNWYSFESRFDVSKNPNEPNRAGYIVEIDPMAPDSQPKKRTALGRFKHENAALVINDDGHVVVYMGDDERGEYLYKFVSKEKYIEGDDVNNADLLDEGTLYVAHFGEADENFKGQGKWIELTFGKNALTPENGISSQAEIAVYTRKAADIVKATTMDRPEWVAAHPKNSYVYCALTNNKNRAVKDNAGGVETPINGPNPRKKNLYGQIVRWQPIDNNHIADNFKWDLFVLAGNPTIHDDIYAGSININPDNMFNSPDGISFDSAGRLWIQTDGKYHNHGSYKGMGNNQMLCADTKTGEIRRFLVGPIACEITGITWSIDEKTMFIGIQHPGENNLPSHFPGGGDSLPRSSIIAIWREDGGAIGA